MKVSFLTICSIRSRGLQAAPALALLSLALSAQATDPLWINTGTITSPPQIDASNFVNSGSMNIGSTQLPFETSNTHNYTNSGTMIGAPGWFFDNAAPDSGERVPADNFVNLNDGTIEGLDGGTVVVIGVGARGVAPPSYLWVSASNVINKGTLSVGGNGWLKINATNVDVSRGALEVTALQPQGSFNIPPSNYVNDVGISDLWWGQTNANFSTARIWDGTTATAPSHQVQNGPGGPLRNVSFSMTQPYASGISNATGFIGLTLTNSDGSTTNVTFPTNIVKQAVFVGVGDPSIMSASATFFPSSNPLNPFRTISVQLVFQSTNVITGNLDASLLYFYDQLASETNRGLLINLNNPAPPPLLFEKPANYLLSRIDNGDFLFGAPGNVTSPDRFFLFDPTSYSNAVVSGEYSGYAAAVDNLASEPPPVAPGTVTNLPGRVQIFADNVDLGATRIRGEGEVIVHANHLLSSAGTAVDCQNLSYFLGSTNGRLNVVNLSKPSVLRLKGNLFAWSGLWTNSINMVITNNFSVTNTFDTNGVPISTNATQVPLTNTITIEEHALVLDGLNLASQVPVITWDMVAHSTNIVISDSMGVVQTFLLDGQSFTLNSNLRLTSTTLANTLGQSVTTAINDWVYTNAPTLLYFTNNGSLSVPSEAHFGDDRPIPYSDYVNMGTISAGSIAVNSGYIENDGSMNASVGPLNLVGATGKFQTGQTSSGGDLNFTFADLKFFSHRLTAAGAINFNVTDALADAGAGSSNSFTMHNGFNLPVKPNTGDLLGTTFQDQAPNFVQVPHVWAGADRGASASGYSDNTALGKLILNISSTTTFQLPQFAFTGAGAQNGLYVDLLDLTTLGSNYLAVLQINPNITIYYAAAKLGFTPPPNASGVPQEPEEFLNGQFGGHLVWVSGFAGPNSSTAVIVNGQTVLMNTALRNSKIIDSDGDGIPNFFDTTPLGGSGGSTPPGFVLGPGLLSRPATSQQVFSLSWSALANTAYRVEVSTNLADPNWQLVTSYTNTLPTTANVTISDTNSPAGRQRFYRVRIAP